MGKAVLITGASSGFGIEFAKKFASTGRNLVLVSRNQNRLNILKHKLSNHFGVKVEIIIADLAEKDVAEKIYEQVEAKGIEIDILINNAGFGDFHTYYNCDWEKQYEMIQVNIVALMQLTRLFAEQMVKHKKGRILNMASAASFQPGPLYASYYASKAFVLSFTEAIAEELKGTGVHAMALCPGPTRTNFVDRADAEQSRLFKVLKVADPKKVVAYGYYCMMRNKVVAVSGIQNKLLVLASKFSPKCLLRCIMYQLHKSVWSNQKLSALDRKMAYKL